MSKSQLTQAPPSMPVAEYITSIESKAKSMREFIQRWIDIIQGGTPINQLEPWARAYVLEAQKLLESTWI